MKCKKCGCAMRVVGIVKCKKVKGYKDIERLIYIKGACHRIASRKKVYSGVVNLKNVYRCTKPRCVGMVIR